MTNTDVELAYGMPAKGVSSEAILEELAARSSGEQLPIYGRFSVSGMKGSKDVQALSKEVFSQFFSHNALYSVVLPSIGRLEDELLTMCIGIFNGGPEQRANLTSGGTDSIFCALHAAREWAKDHKPCTGKPEIIVPYSAHPAFSRGAHYLGIKLVRTSLREDYRADVAAMEAAITPNTIGIVGSAPSWPYGYYDPLEEISDLALKHNLWMHVDACLGGYLGPFVRKAGYTIPAFDFELPGVCSISADIHKYAYAPKGISSVFWRSSEHQSYHYTMVDDWPTGAYFTQSHPGSRHAGPIAAAWAIMKYLGEEGKVALAKQTMEVKQRIIDELTALGGIQPWDNDLTPLNISSDTYDVQEIVTGMSEKGWFMLGTPEPPIIQLSIDSVPEDIVDLWLMDFKDTVNAIRNGHQYAKGALAYTFEGVDAAALEGIPNWVKQSLPIMRNVSEH